MAQTAILKPALVGAVVLIAGCASDPVTEVQTEQVKVPVERMPQAPGQLRDDYQVPTLPTFVALDHENATMALTKAGARDLQLLLDSLDTRRRAWRTWYMEQRQEGAP